MNFKEFGVKVKDGAVKVFKSLNKKILVTVGAVLVLACAVVLNFILVPEQEKKGEGLDVALDLTDVSAVLAERERGDDTVSGEGKTDILSEMSLSRKQARDEAMEVLNGVAQSSTAIDSMKQDALNSIKSMADDIEKEANIESLVMAKGFEECVAVVNGDTASVIVRTEGLLDTQVAQISEIVWEQAGVHPDNLNIIESE